MNKIQSHLTIGYTSATTLKLNLVEFTTLHWRHNQVLQNVLGWSKHHDKYDIFSVPANCHPFDNTNIHQNLWHPFPSRKKLPQSLSKHITSSDLC